MCSLKLPVAVVETIGKYRKDCLWRDSDFRKKGYNLAAWKMVMKPKDKGGLGVVDLQLQNDALLLKQLDKFYRKKDVQWVKLIWERYYPDGVPHLGREKGSFWWKDILRLHQQYRGVAMCIPHKEDTISFWDDIILGNLFSLKYPNLHSFAKDVVISLMKVKESENLVNLFRIPMTRQAHNELLQLVDDLSELSNNDHEENDEWTFIWGILFTLYINFTITISHPLGPQ